MKLAGVLLVALSLSIGWGIRGNWGHEYGAMIPGALAALAACLLPGREDWRRRAVYFAFFGALGWSFGGSMSYGRVLGYTHSASLPDTVYGFAMTFVIGFLWGAVGGAGCALPAFLDRKRLAEFFPPLVAIFAAWLLMDAVALPLASRGGFEQRLDWYDTDWLGVLVLIVATLTYVAWRRAISPAASLILQMAGGWWAGFLLLVVLLGLRMTPPRGDNWAGMLGMTVALLIYCFRNGLPAVAWTAIVTGTFAGVGFSFGLLVRGLGIASGIAANWHSVLEQSFGFIAGIGVALCMGYIAARSPRLQDNDDARDWTEPFALAFLLLVVTYLNISKNVWSVWLPNKVVPPAMIGIPAAAWFTSTHASLPCWWCWSQRRRLPHLPRHPRCRHQREKHWPRRCWCSSPPRYCFR